MHCKLTAFPVFFKVLSYYWVLRITMSQFNISLHIFCIRKRNNQLGNGSLFQFNMTLRIIAGRCFDVQRTHFLNGKSTPIQSLRHCSETIYSTEVLLIEPTAYGNLAKHTSYSAIDQRMTTNEFATIWNKGNSCLIS